jgi:exodeoxyribonuclease-3
MEKIPEQAIKDAGYHAIWHGQKSWNGVAILSRHEPPEEITRALPGDPEDINSRYIEAKVNGIIIGCLYLPNGNPTPGPKFDYKMQWMERFTLHTAELLVSDVPVILTGDYNVIPTEIDVYRPERWVKDALFLPEVRAAFRTITEQGWTDAIRKLYPDEVIYTYFDFFRNAYARNAGLRIDHFLLSHHFDKRLIAGGVNLDVRGWEKTSDHAPVWIEVAEEQK